MDKSQDWRELEVVSPPIFKVWSLDQQPWHHFVRKAEYRVAPQTSWTRCAQVCTFKVEKHWSGWAGSIVSVAFAPDCLASGHLWGCNPIREHLFHLWIVLFKFLFSPTLHQASHLHFQVGKDSQRKVERRDGSYIVKVKTFPEIFSRLLLTFHRRDQLSHGSPDLQGDLCRQERGTRSSLTHPPGSCSVEVCVTVFLEGAWEMDNSSYLFGIGWQSEVRGTFIFHFILFFPAERFFFCGKENNVCKLWRKEVDRKLTEPLGYSCPTSSSEPGDFSLSCKMKG